MKGNITGWGLPNAPAWAKPARAQGKSRPYPAERATKAKLRQPPRSIAA